VLRHQQTEPAEGKAPRAPSWAESPSLLPHRRTYHPRTSSGQTSRHNSRFHLFGVKLGGVSSGAMARPPAIRAAVRKRGNPYWGHALPPAPVLATAFELETRKLHLNPEKYVFSSELRRWCWQNRNRVYIPEWLLGEWDITVDPNVSDAA
jgi:hypothetical protein